MGEVCIGEKHAHAEAINIAPFAVFLLGLLRAVTECTLTGKVDGFRIRSEQLDFGNVQAGLGLGQVAAVPL